MDERRGSGIRMTAEERRQTVLAAAAVCFAKGGLTGTSTEAIARRAGISQPYLFRLFPTKKALFAATLQRTFERIEARFAAAAEGLGGEEALCSMGRAYKDILAQGDLLAIQFHCYAAGDDEEVGPVARACFRHLWDTVACLSGVGQDRLREFFATGMLLNVVAALHLGALDPDLAQRCMPPDMAVASVHAFSSPASLGG